MKKHSSPQTSRAPAKERKHSVQHAPADSADLGLLSGGLASSAPNQSAGCLYVVATPIGNLADMSLRAIDTLKSVNGIYCEDTRTSATLLKHYGIQTQTRSLHDHNESARIDAIKAQLSAGERWALISDAGTPLISDPGYRVVTELRKAGFQIIAIPGPSALTAALSIAGMDTTRFGFEGFLPASDKARIDALSNLQNEARTLVFYESSHRIVALLLDLKTLMPERPIAVVKELSKQFERVLSGSAAEILSAFEADPALRKGEFVVLMAAAPSDKHAISGEIKISAASLLRTLQTELSPSSAAKLAAKLLGLKKSELYRLGLLEAEGP
jgi:16S rRNA (cytidine1402-2'-O)-methyltransferase